MTRRPVLRLMCVSALVASAGACGTTGPRDPLFELERNFLKWQAAGLVDYSFAVARICFCPPEHVGPVRVTVLDEVAIQRRYVETGELVPADRWDSFPTVDGLFDVLRDAYEGEADRVEVSYDGDTGVPVDFYIDYEEQAADEELGFQVTEAVTIVNR